MWSHRNLPEVGMIRTNLRYNQELSRKKEMNSGNCAQCVGRIEVRESLAILGNATPAREWMQVGN